MLPSLKMLSTQSTTNLQMCQCYSNSHSVILFIICNYSYTERFTWEHCNLKISENPFLPNLFCDFFSICNHKSINVCIGHAYTPYGNWLFKEIEQKTVQNLGHVNNLLNLLGQALQHSIHNYTLYNVYRLLLYSV